jgi:predicted RNA binding protein YcfA (HicA-like mRNA interferase family)
MLKREGWFEVRQKGSHMVLHHPDRPDQLIFPYHGSKEIKTGLANAILKKAGLK